MTNITILGGTGYAGRHLAREATSRGHHVVAVSRRAPDASELLDHVDYRQIDLSETHAAESAISGSDVVIAAMSPRGGFAERLSSIYRRVADEAARTDLRLFVIGGFSSLRRAPGLPRVIDEGMPEDVRIPADQLAALMVEATTMNSVLLDLEQRTDDLRWTFISPAMEFGAHAPGEPTGRYRVGTDGLVLTDADGRSAVGGADFARATLDEVESGSSRLGHLAIAY